VFWNPIIISVSSSGLFTSWSNTSFCNGLDVYRT
jgi:hypothetical protein